MPVVGVDSIFGIAPGYYLLAAIVILIVTAFIAAVKA
jgi:hypothetical protein